MSGGRQQISSRAGIPVSGFADGMIISFGLSSALALKDVSDSVQLTVALVVALSGMILFGIAVYKSGLDRGFDHSHHNELFKNLGLDEKEMEDAGEEITSEHEQLQFEEIPKNVALRSGIFTALAFFTGYILAFLPFLLISHLPTAMAISFSLTPLILFMAGYVKNRFPGSDPLYGGIRYMFLGLFVAAALCWVSWLF